MSSEAPLAGVCKTAERLGPYLDGELSVTDREEIAEHLRDCAECALLLESQSRVKDGVRRAVSSIDVPSGLRDSIRQRLQDNNQQ